MKDQKQKAAAEPTDYLRAVRDTLTATPRSDFMRIAHDSGLHLRTLYSLLEDPNKDPRYSTVHALYRTLTRTPTTDRRKANREPVAH